MIKNRAPVIMTRTVVRKNSQFGKAKAYPYRTQHKNRRYKRLLFILRDGWKMSLISFSHCFFQVSRFNRSYT